ncbi:MAG: hypothetical protein DWQ08_12660 [Proteobacteria bacterium]|nr:MAG: hypothetical protein DWQ08_12660 [Pseudomonadota bacterium]
MLSDCEANGTVIGYAPSPNYFTRIIMAIDDKYPEETANEPDKENSLDARRRIVRNLLIGGGAVAGTATIPEKWSKPMVEGVVLPAHAQTTFTDGTVDLGGPFRLTGDNAPGFQQNVLDAFAGPAHAIDLSDGCISIRVKKSDGSVTRVEVLISDEKGSSVGYKDANVNQNGDGSANFSVSLKGTSVNGKVDANATLATGTADGIPFTATRAGASGCQPKPAVPTTCAAGSPYFTPYPGGRSGDCYSTTRSTTTTTTTPA